jgi:multicomponent K+:H+ antiporter subunit A
VVNVMLVDFRGFDTLGEITVLGIVGAHGVRAAAALPPGAREAMEPPAAAAPCRPMCATDLINPTRWRRPPAVGYLMVPAVLVRLLLPVAACSRSTCSCAGTTSRAAALWPAWWWPSVVHRCSTSFRARAGSSRTAPAAPRWIATGLLLAPLATGLGSLVLGYPFLTTHTAHVTWPLVGEVHVASALFFDIGVFTLVVGSTLLILTAIAHQSVRATAARAGATGPGVHHKPHRPPWARDG